MFGNLDKYDKYNFVDFLTNKFRYSFVVSDSEIKFISHQLIVGKFHLTNSRSIKLIKFISE